MEQEGNLEGGRAGVAVYLKPVPRVSVYISCGGKIAHQAGTSCYGVKRPKCSATMTRDLEK